MRLKCDAATAPARKITRARGDSVAPAPTGVQKKTSKQQNWAKRGHPEYDLRRVIQDDKFLPADPLSQGPPANYSYTNHANPSITRIPEHTKEKMEFVHPNLAKLRSQNHKGIARKEAEEYYSNMPSSLVMPLGGFIDPLEYWIKRNGKAAKGRGKAAKARIVRAQASKVAEEVARAAQATRSEDIQQFDVVARLISEQEEVFHARPSIKIPIPDLIKAMLVDDWENVTKNQQLVPLPCAQPVNKILSDYLEYEKPKRTVGSAQADILEEVIAGLKEYFEKCLGRILLYRFVCF